MTITVEQVKAVEDIGRYSRSMITAEAAERIANAFGFTLSILGIAPEQVEQGIDWGRRMQTWSTGAAVPTYHLARIVADKLSPGWDDDLEPCPYSGAGKSAAWATGTALDAIRQAIDFPSMYVRTVYGEFTIHTAEDGHKFHYLDEERPVLGYELIDRTLEEDKVVAKFEEEEAAYDGLVFLANEGR